MAIIDKRFLYYTTEAGFLKDKKEGRIDSKSVVFLSESGKRTIYTHGKFFNPEVFVVGTQSSSTNAFTGVFNEIDGLYDGLNIRYWLPYNGTSSAATLNLTIGDTTTGAIPVYIKGTTRFTNHIEGTNVLDLTYRENIGGIEKGWWVLGSYGDASDGNTTYTFTPGTDGSFKVKPSDGSEQIVSIGKPSTAGTADKVGKNFVVQVNSGEEEYVSMYTYDGSESKTINIIQGSNISFGVEDGELTINGNYKDATTTDSGLMSSDDKEKLDGIDEGANNYEHPSYTEYSSGLYKITVDAEGHVESATKVVKSDITSLGIPAQDTHYTTGLYIGASEDKSNAATSNGFTYIKLYDDDASRASFKISGSGSTTVGSDTSGNITINSTNTTYTLSGDLDGDTFKSTLTPSTGTATTSTVPVFFGATTSTPGKAGLVPSPESSEYNLFLKADGTWAAPANTVYTHPTYTARTGKPTEDATPGFGETFTVSQITSNTLGHVTGAIERTITIPSSVATTGSAGLMSAGDKEKLDGITAGANKYILPKSTIEALGGIKIAKDNDAYTVTTATSNISANITTVGKYYGVELDSTGKAFVYVPWSNTKNTAGSTNSSSKLFLIGATTQTESPQTYSHDTAYVDIDGHLYSNSKQVVNLSDIQALTNKTYDGYTLGAACAKSVTTSVTSGSSSLVTSGAVYTAIANAFKANDAMVFKGTLGTSNDGGTVSALPATHNVGWTYRVVTAGTYAGNVCEIGDLIICITEGDAASNAHWTVAQTNIDGAVVGPTSSTDGRVALFSGTSGKVLKQSPYTLGCSVPSDAKFTDTTYTLSDFGITATATELNYCSGVTSNIQTQLNGKAATNHDHDSVYLKLSGGTISSSSYGPLVIKRDGSNNMAAIKFENNLGALGSIGMKEVDGNLIRYNAATNASYNILDSSNSSVSLSENTLTVKINGTSCSLTNTDKVKQTSSTTNAAYPILTATSANPTSGTAYESYYNTEVTINPSTKTITATTFSGNATSATKLKDARTIDGVDFNGTAEITHYGTCSTATATAAKTVALTGFKLVTGSRIAVKFTVTNTASSPTLNVNSTGAKAIVYRGSAISAGYLAANRVYEFIYDGTDYELIGDINTDTVYTLPLADSGTRGGIKIGYTASGASVPVQLSSEKAYVTLTKTAVTTALGYTPPTTNTTYSIATNTTSGLIKPWYYHSAASTGPTTGTDSTAVAVNAISTTSGRYYAVEMDSAGRAFVNVPWVDNDTDTKNTAGAGEKASTKLFLVGRDEQSTGTSYSNSKVYIGTDNCLYSDGSKVSVSGHTHSYVPLAGGTMTGDLTFDYSTSGGAQIVFKNGRIVEGGGGWADKVLNLQNSAGTSIGTGYGIFGNGNVLSYIYLGHSSDYTGNNFRIYSDKITFGDNTVLHAGNYGTWAATKDHNHDSAYAAKSHTHNYAGSSSAGGAATSANKLNTDAGSTTKPVYFSEGIPKECSTYAGGTKVTFNGSDKGASTASFYAPTAAGTKGQVLVSTAGAPGWKDFDEIGLVTSSDVATISQTITTSWAPLVTAANMAKYCPEAGTYVIQVSGSGIGVCSGIFSWNTSGSTQDEILLHRTGASSSNIYLRLSSRVLQIAGSDAITTAFTITVKVKRLI